VATPHVEQVDVRTLPDRVAEVRAALAAEGIPLEVRVGGELKPESVGELDADELELIAHGPPDARWLLFEVPFSGVDDEFLAAADELRGRGYGLLLAHPERSRGLLDDGALQRLDPLVAAGALFALNVAPMTGRESEDRAEAAAHLIDAGRVDVVVTDAHPPRRPFQLADTRGLVDEAAFTTVPATLLERGLPPR
jgi:protein-tyrosine phosphatase